MPVGGRSVGILVGNPVEGRRVGTNVLGARVRSGFGLSVIGILVGNTVGIVVDGRDVDGLRDSVGIGDGRKTVVGTCDTEGTLVGA